MGRLLRATLLAVLAVACTLNVASAKGASMTKRTVTYCTPGGVPLAADVFTPATVRPNMPLVIYMHGGGFAIGDKNELTQGNYRNTALADLGAAGFVVASINYRLTPTYPLPAQIVDAKCAVRHFRANAASYSINPDRIGVWGGSAGGHLAAMLAASDASAGWDTGQWLDVPSTVQAALDAYGPMDLTTMPGLQPADWDRMLGPGWTEDTKAQVSPISHVSGDEPPILLQHGLADTDIPASQAQAMYDRLRAAGVTTAELQLISGGNHGFITNKSRPSPTDIGHAAATFFKRTLGG